MRSPHAPCPPGQCGPDGCDLVCPQGSQCVQDPEVQCVLAPCCPQWSCQACPSQRPDFQVRGIPELSPNLQTIIQSDCGPEMEGISCDYGSTLCCGETFPEIVLTCMGGRWEGYYIDTPCILIPGHTFKMTSHNEMQCQ